MANSYRSYVLTIKNNHEIIEIDWTKIKQFSDLKKKKYKLEQIDFFTQHFINQEELFNFLLETNLLTLDQLKKAKVWIYPAKQNSITKIIDGKKRKVSAPLYASEHLQYGVIYQEYKDLLADDSCAIRLLQSKLNDYNFIIKLYNKYSTNGKYNERNCNNQKLNINFTKDAIKKAKTEQERIKKENILKSYYKQYYDLSSMYGLLESIKNFAERLKNGEIQSEEAIISAQNNIREFYLREKYYVTGYADKINDAGILEYKKDKNGNRSINYLKFHNLIMLIIKCLNEEKNEQIVHNQKKHNIKDKKQIDGQITLWDLDLQNNDKIKIK